MSTREPYDLKRENAEDAARIEERRRILARSRSLGCSADLVELIEGLEARIKQLEDKAAS